MKIYWIALLMTVFFAWILTSKNINLGYGRYGKVTYIRVGIAFSPLFLLELLRWNVGVDVVYGTGYYYLEYNAIQAGEGNVLGYEIGFYLLMEICNALQMNLYMFYCVVTVIFFAFFVKYITENADNIILCAIVFFTSDLYLFTFSTLRQSMGIAFFLYPMSEMLNGNKYWKNLKWWLCTIITISMHTSIVYLLLVLVISRVHIRKKALFCITILGCVLSPVLRALLFKAMSHTYYFAKYFGSNEYYMEFTPTYFFIALLVFVPLYIFYDKFMENENNYIMINVSALVVLLMFNSQVLLMPYRIFSLFVPVYIVLIARLIEKLSCRSSIRFIGCVYFIMPFLFLFINQYYLNGASALFEYKSIFQYMNQVW